MKPTIGLEIHVELDTKTKMFCDSLNNSLEKEPNTNICPICTAQPGSMPVINEKAIDFVIKAGLALGCKINKKTWFERKSYFYPDLPKGYQISQYEAPLCGGGELKNIRINRIHLEEDTGRLIHNKESFVDFNRAGIPLMELVTEPDICSSIEAKNFAQELQLIFRYLKISNADMEKGQMRVEANISLDMGTKVEIKNLNSFKAVERAIEYEIKRQKEILDSNKKVIHETRGWDDKKQETFSQRIKETSEDYRYFPEPDLPILNISDKKIQELRFELPELPENRRKRFEKEYKIKDVEFFINNPVFGDFFENTISELKAWLEAGKINTDIDPLIRLCANYISTEFPKLKGEITPENFAELIYLTFIGDISSSGAQQVLKEMFKTKKDPSQIIKQKNLKQMSDKGDLDKIIDKIIENNKEAVDNFKKGKQGSLQFLIGQVMKETKGAANPKIAGEMIEKRL
ncbi:Asp-tRNA(Asn)/Glu-tRNA(Gln) amidotransferase subunit GatB [Patescibacteria group bacterium]|nr:Asp-tRNA(Asn)/Glu-tRNA(Gln) amidotransferase subunit GatB [Patescibacteria group bacterium]